MEETSSDSPCKALIVCVVVGVAIVSLMTGVGIVVGCAINHGRNWWKQRQTRDIVATEFTYIEG